MRRRCLLVAQVVLVAAVAGCGGDDRSAGGERSAPPQAETPPASPSSSGAPSGGSCRSDRGNTDDTVDDRIEANEERLKENPRDVQARKELVRDCYSKAASLAVGQAGEVPPEAQDALRATDANYQAYLDLKPEPPDASLALTAIQLYGPGGLDEPKKVLEAARLRVAGENDFQSYLLLVNAAALAGDTRTSHLAGVRAVDLAPKAQKKQVKRAVEQTQLAAQPPRPSQGPRPPRP